jgi:hypothetical protein
MNNVRFSLPSLFGLVAVVAAALGAWLNASVAVLTALFIVTVVELAVAAHGAYSDRGAAGAFCGGFALAGSAALVLSCAYLWAANEDLEKPWIKYLAELTYRPHGWILRDPVATAAVMCICLTLGVAFLGGAVARIRHRRVVSEQHHRILTSVPPVTKRGEPTVQHKR